MAIEIKPGRHAEVDLTSRDGMRAWLGRALRGAAVLKVVTVVGEVTVGNLDGSDTTAEGPVASVAGPQRGAYTAVDLLSGDITTVVDPSYFAADATALRDFHVRQVETSRLIVEGNLKTMAGLVEQLWDRLDGSGKAAG